MSINAGLENKINASLPNNQKTFLFGLIVHIIKIQKTSFYSLIASLFVLAFSQSILLFSLGPLIKTIFKVNTFENTIRLVEILSISEPNFFFSYLQKYTFNKQQLIQIIPVIIISSGLLKNISSYYYQISINTLSLSTAKWYRNSLFTKLIKKPLNLIHEKSSAQWMSVIMNDVLYLQNKLSDILNCMIKDFVIIFASFITLFVLQWRISLFLLFVIPIVCFSMGRTANKISKYTQQTQYQLSKIADSILEVRKRLFFIKSQQGEVFEWDIFSKASQKYYLFISKSIFLKSLFAPIAEFIGFLIFSIILFVMHRYSFHDELNPMFIIMFFATLGIILKPLKNLGEQVSKYYEITGSINKNINIILEKNAEENKNPHEKIFENYTKNKIYFSKLQCGYTKNSVLSCKDLTINFGQTIAIIGPSGSGKSTLLKTLSGLLYPISWKASQSWKDLASQTALVSQYPFLFNATIYENLSYGNTLITQSQIKGALEATNLTSEIKMLPQQLNSHFNSIDTNLSGGQIQRLVIARTLLQNKQGILLDEASSALDQKNSLVIHKQLIDHIKKNNKFLIFVTHQTEHLQLFDSIYQISNENLCLYANNK